MIFNDSQIPNQHALLFGIRRSMRYHSHRRQFFDGINNLVTALSLIFGSATIYLRFAHLEH